MSDSFACDSWCFQQPVSLSRSAKSCGTADQWLVGAQTGVWRAWRGRLTRRWKTEPLQAGEGAAYEVGCQGNLAVWATAAGVTVVDVSCDQVILKVPHHERYARCVVFALGRSVFNLRIWTFKK